MRTYLDKAFIDENLLKDDEYQRIESEHSQKLSDITEKYGQLQQKLADEEEKLYEQIAKTAGFSGYSTGSDSYLDGYERSIRNPQETDKQLNDKLRKFFMLKLDTPEYMDLVARNKQAKAEEQDERRWAEQVRLNKILTATYLRSVPRRDSNKQLLMSRKAYNALTAEQKEQLERPITKEFNLKAGGRKETVAIDAGISEYVSRLWDAGVRTNASCSGMVADHPYHRYESDDRFGRWKKGDLVKAGINVCGAYLSIPVKDNNDELLKRVIDKSRDWGWTTDRRKIYGEESIVFYLPHTLDGTAYDSILTEAYKMKDDFIQSGEASNEYEAIHMAFPKVEKNHGGMIHFTDRMLSYNFRVMTEGIVDIMRNIREEQRDRNIRENKAVTLYRYDYDVPCLTPEQLNALFRRSGIQLDMSTVNRPMDSNCLFIVNHGKAKAWLAPEDQPQLPRTMVKGNHYLSYLMAEQVRSTPLSDSKRENITVMVHPEPQSVEVYNQFTVTKRLPFWVYNAYFSNENDLKQLFSNYFCKELYQAAQHAYDCRQDKVDNMALNALTDIRIQSRLDGHTYISCKIDGEQQISKRMKQSDVDYYKTFGQVDREDGHITRELAAIYFSEELKTAQEWQQRQNGSIKR